MLDRRDVLDALPVDRSVEDLKLLPQLRVLGPLGEEVVGGHAELVVLDGDVEARVGQLGRERRPLVEQAGPDPRGLSGLGEGQRGGHGLRVVWRYFFGFFFFFLVWGSRWGGRAAGPGLKRFCIEGPYISIRPDADAPAMPSADTIWPTSSPCSLAAAMVAPNTPVVGVV